MNYGAKTFLAPRITERRDNHIMGLLLEFIAQTMPEKICAPLNQEQGADSPGGEIQTRN